MIKLSEISAGPPEDLSKKQLKKQTEALFRHIGDLTMTMSGEQKNSLLVVFQGMDSSGKDGATRNIFKYCSPGIVHAFSFKKPTDEEFAHDFLWRVHKRTPSKGMVSVFNRSHYEDILIQRVHGWISEEKVKMRMNAINAFETLLQEDNNTTILKFYMHISKDKQQEELQERIDDPNKHWKHNENDWKEREHWDKYMNCYEYAINESVIPWHIVPVNSRWYRDYYVAKTIVDTLESFKMELPGLDRS